MNFGIHNGGCANRMSCANVNKKVCNQANIKSRKVFGLFKVHYIECEHYKEIK